MALGNIILRVSPLIQQDLGSQDYACKAWEHLTEVYGKSTATSIFRDFKSALNLHINPTQYPGPQIDHFVASIQRLASTRIMIPKLIQGMMLLSTLPQKWEMLASIVINANNLDNIDIDTV